MIAVPLSQNSLTEIYTVSVIKEYYEGEIWEGQF